MHADKGNIIISRLALERRVSPPPTIHHIALHKPLICHNPACFNYRHLRWGTHKENILDRNIDLTHNQGERNGQSKITEDIVRKIRKDKRKQYIIASEYEVGAATVSGIKSRQRWRHVK